MKNSNPDVKSLYDLYRHLDLPVDWIESAEGFTVYNLKYIDFQLPYESPTFRPDYFSFLFVKDGKGRYTIDKHSFNVEANSIYFTNPGNFRTFSWSSIEEVYLMTFDETFLKRFVGKEVFEEFPFLLTEIVRPKVVKNDFYTVIKNVYLQIHTEYFTNDTNKTKIIGHLLAVLLFKIKQNFWKDYDPIHEGNRSSEIVKSFKLLLEKHYREVSTGTTETLFKVQDYANAQNLHPNYLSNVIKIKTGKSISVWIAEKTISEAKSLLQNTSLSIKEITYRLGFMETAHFSNYFKKATKLSPIQYRKEQNKNR